MQKYWLAFTFAWALVTPAAAQKQIKEKEVARIVRTLSADDMQGRQVFTPGIQKASQFIQQEFKKIGLEPLPGLTSYEQAFTVIQVTPIATSVTINGEDMPAASVITSVAQETVNWSPANAADVEQVRITAGANFVAEAGKLSAGNKNRLVLVDPGHAAIFKRYKNYLEHHNIQTERKNTTVVFVLTGQSEINNYQVNIKSSLQEQQLNNVVGYLPGKSRHAESVIFSAHYDHIGVLKPEAGDSIANGADDDASGTTAVIALARHFKKQKDNERSLIFVAFTAEEVGGYGSQYFSKQQDPAQIMGMFNIEMIGKESKFGKKAAFITGFERSDFGSILQKNLAGTGYAFHPDPYVSQNLFYRSDNATLARLGVPAHSISSDQIDIDKLYHSVDDEFESLDIANMTHLIKAIAKGAASIISGQDTPSRVTLEGNE